ncbi:MAG: amidohydrolase [Longimicrobiales bacterium]
MSQRPKPREYVNQLKIGGIKIVATDATRARGRASLSQTELDAEFDSAYARGWQVLMHCTGDACADLMIAAVQKAQAKHGRLELRPIMLHAQLVREDQLDVMKSLGIIPNFCAQSYYWSAGPMEERLGRERAWHRSPLVAAQRRAMVAANHTDAPAVPPDPLFLLHTAVNRTSRHNTIIGVGQRSSPREALKAITLHGAYLYFEEKEKGSIEPGKRADMVVLSANPLTVQSREIKNIRVLKTIKDGQVIYDAGAPILTAGAVTRD